MEIYLVIREPKGHYRASLHSIAVFIQAESARAAVKQAEIVGDEMSGQIPEYKAARAVLANFGQQFYL